MRDIQTILLQDSARLTETLGLDPGSARIEVQCLLQLVLNVTRAYLPTHPERRLNKPEQARYDELLQRRLSGEPIAYLLGEREFFGLVFKVTPATLIPRPETELLVELALQRIPSSSTPLPQPASPPSLRSPRKRERVADRPGEGLEKRNFSVLDLGTGSGAIALAIAHARPDVTVLACDASTAALEVARDNAQRLGVANVASVLSDWFQALAEKRFDIIVANPPYVAAGDPHLAQGDVRFEPLSALVSGGDGLHDIRHIISTANHHLQAGGWLLIEHAYDQAARVRELLQQAGFDQVFSAPDLAGIERVSGGCLTINSAHQ
ncbi:MAG: peptide chain release factor N(5)-glutamine methyltransferase [Gallionellaceae bacterium]|nr:peptide chain release factor N(5)-glutamine methyltransferase [Gallionellaceae bacterium]